MIAVIAILVTASKHKAVGKRGDQTSNGAGLNITSVLNHTKNTIRGVPPYINTTIAKRFCKTSSGGMATTTNKPTKPTPIAINQLLENFNYKKS